MKKQIIFTMLSLSALNIVAQDIIVMKNGDEVEAKVTKVGTTEVEYPNGRIKTDLYILWQNLTCLW